MPILHRLSLLVTALCLLTQCAGFEVNKRKVGRTTHFDFTFDTPQNRFNEAVKKGDVARVRKYATPKLVNQPVNGEYPLVRAVSSRNEAMVQALSDAGADWRVRSNSGKSLAYLAGYRGDTEKGIEYAQRGGGSASDARAGYAQWKAEEPERIAQQRQMNDIGTALIGFMVKSMLGGSRSSGDNLCNVCGEYRAAINGNCSRCTAYMVYGR